MTLGELAFACYIFDKIEQAAGISNFVVIPGDKFEEIVT